MPGISSSSRPAKFAPMKPAAPVTFNAMAGMGAPVPAQIVINLGIAEPGGQVEALQALMNIFMDADAAADVLDCPVYMHEADACSYRGRVDSELKGGDVLDLDGEILEIMSTPGHTKGSICIMSEKSRVCFTGDTVFDTDLGRTDLEGGSEEEMKSSIRNIVDKWDNDIHIYPGHDDGCTMKQVRKYNTEFIAITEGRNR